VAEAEDQVHGLLEQEREHGPAHQGQHTGQLARHPALVHGPVQQPARCGQGHQGHDRAEDDQPRRTEPEEPLRQPGVLLLLPGGLHTPNAGPHRAAHVPAGQQQGEGERAPDVDVEHLAELLLQHAGHFRGHGAIDQALQEDELVVEIEKRQHPEQAQQSRRDGQHQVESHRRTAGTHLVVPHPPAQLLRRQHPFAEPHHARAVGGSAGSGRSS